MIGYLRLPSPPQWNNRRCKLSNHQPPIPHNIQPVCALSKQAERFFTSIAVTTFDNPSAIDRSLRKFVSSSPKSVTLDALSHLLSENSSYIHLSFLAFPLYCMMSEASWFSWNSKLVAEVVALLYKQECFDEAAMLISDTVVKVQPRERELCSFYCSLISFHSKHKSMQGVFDVYARLKELLQRSSSVYVKRQAYESIIGGMCEIDMPHEAEDRLKEMKELGIKMSMFEFRSIVYSYGRLGLFEDMKRIIALMESEGFKLDTVCSNMVLSALGSHNELTEMELWLQRMKEVAIPCSIRTYNSVLNSCPTIIPLLQDKKTAPLSISELINKLSASEALLVRQLISSSVLAEAMEWSPSELKLDLHGMHVSSAYLIILQWFDELQTRFVAGDEVIPMEITVVCGSGKHSNVRGESPVKGMVKEMIVRMKSPLKIDRRNIGCLVAKGKVFKQWLC